MGIYAVFLLLAYYLEETLGFTPLRTASPSCRWSLPSPSPRASRALGCSLAPGPVPWSDRDAARRHGHGALHATHSVLGLLGPRDARDSSSPDSGSDSSSLRPSPAPRRRIEPRDAGAASALVNTTQQIGGSLGTALLNTIDITVTLRALHHGVPVSAASSTAATLHGYSVAFWWAAGFFGLGTMLTLFMLESGAPADEPALAPRRLDQRPGIGRPVGGLVRLWVAARFRRVRGRAAARGRAHSG